MHVLYLLCFTVFVKHTFAHVIDHKKMLPGYPLRSKREAECGWDVIVSGGTAEIQLPTETINGTEFYSANAMCKWNIKTSPDHYIILRSDYFSLEESENCVWDYVQIDDAGVTSRFCGREPMTYITTSNEIVLHFQSDVSYEYKGFKFMLESKQKDADVSKCDSSVIGGEDSRITNKEEVGSGCIYRIQAPEGKVVELNLKMLDFGSATCEEESIVVYEGLTSHGEPLATICSTSVHGIQSYHVNMVFIEYRNPLQQEGERFTIEYSFVEDNFTPAPTPSTTSSPVGGHNDCSGLFKDLGVQDDEFIYTAPEYEDDKECVVVFRNTLLQKFVVQIEFLYFDIEDSDNCMFDSLRVLSGERNDSTMLGGPYCGESLHGRTFVTSGNSLRLEFRTDVSFALRGFKAKITLVPSTECVCKGYEICVRQSYEKICTRGRRCTANPCQNGGTCVKSGSTQKCFCRSGFQGDDCSESDGEKFYHLHFTLAPTDHNLKRDGSHTEQCAVKVPPGEQVQYDWTLNGVLIEPYNSRSGFGTYPGGVLQIDKFTDRLEGQYSCFASTSAGTAEHTFEYRIVEKCDVRIYPGPQSMSKKINEQALLTCHVDKRAKSIRWKKDGVNINFDDKRFQQMVNNYLLITNIGMSDAGTYRCEAEDENGCFSHKEGKLTVIDVKPLNKYCGISVHDEAILASSRISKGNAARPFENPWHVTFSSKKGRTFCGGTLISQKYVLTAAHCIKEFKKKLDLDWKPENVYILLGTTNCQRKDNETTKTFKSYAIHPDYGKSHTYDSDIALVELDSPVEYTDAIRPICLEPAAYNDRVFLEDSDSLIPIPGKVAGCGQKRATGGRARVLQEVHLPYVPRERCESSLEKSNEKVTDRMFCAGSNIAMSGDACIGDSGGGLVMTAASRWVQTGIVSWSVGRCDSDGKYGIYTHVGVFYDWIESIAKLSEQEGKQFNHLHFTLAPTDRNLKRDGSHTEECAVKVPQGEQVQYDWTLNGVLIEPYNHRSGFGTHPGGVLQIDKFTDRLEGEYSCFASTSAGTAEHTFEYRIVEQCDVRIYPGPQSMSKKINEQALLTCYVDKQAKSIRWKKDGDNINFDDKRFKQLVNNYLLITNVEMSDAGTFRCEVEDENGCFSHKEGKLTVINVKPLNNYCGISVYDEAILASSRISKGKDAQPFENPWHVTFNSIKGLVFCGGTLISQKYVLTAAHCIKKLKIILDLDWKPENVNILLGTTNCQRRGDETTRTLKSYAIHPDYAKSHPYDSDIALVELDSPVEYKDAIRPICLEPAAYNDRVFLEDSDSLLPIYGKVAGCGRKFGFGGSARVLQEVHLPYVPREECERSLEKSNFTVTDRMFCAGSNIAKTGDTCKGDVGGGLVMTADSRWVQTGIVSWSVGHCDSTGYYGVYTHVGVFYDWIESIAKLSEEELPDFLTQS